MPGLIETNSASTQDVPERAGVYLLTHPRSASNLFQTMMEKQPGYQTSGYKLFEAAYAPLMSVGSGPLSEKPVEEREKMYEAFRKGAKDIEAEIADAKSKGLQVFVKEHVILLHGADKMFKAAWPTDAVPPLILESDAKTPHTNPSTLPDSLLLSLQPIFQIRNPILMFPSLIRAQRDSYNPNLRPSDKVCKLMLTLRHSRELYDWYLTHAPADRKPRVIDADDIMNDKDAVHKLCLQTGLDPSAVQYEWDAKPEFDDPLKKRFLSTISNSKGIIPGLAAKGLDFEKEREKWRKEFGEEDGEELARFVQESMSDYEYLLSQRTRGGKE